MQLTIKVIPGSRQNLYKKDASGIKVYLTAPPVEGKANQSLVKFLAKHFGVNTSRIGIIKGLKSRNKIVQIEEI